MRCLAARFSIAGALIWGSLAAPFAHAVTSAPVPSATPLVQASDDADTAPRLENAASPNNNNGQPSDAERRFRIALMQRSMGFGGIFGGLIAPLNKPGSGGGGGGGGGKKDCGSYSNYAACQAYRNGDNWAADRIQEDRSTPAEKDWYGH